MKQNPWRGASYWLVPQSLLCLLWCTVWDHLPRGSTVQSNGGIFLIDILSSQMTCLCQGDHQLTRTGFYVEMSMFLGGCSCVCVCMFSWSELGAQDMLICLVGLEVSFSKEQTCRMWEVVCCQAARQYACFLPYWCQSSMLAVWMTGSFHALLSSSLAPLPQGVASSKCHKGFLRKVLQGTLVAYLVVLQWSS